MSRRFQARRGNGRFTRNTMENTFGLSVDVCPHCRRFNPRPAYEKAAENCHACGKPLREIDISERAKGSETGHAE
jgi:hypothetical protein